MFCELCGDKTKVVDSASDGSMVVRKRKCKVCSHIFYTQEIDFCYYDGGPTLYKFKFKKEKEKLNGN